MRLGRKFRAGDPVVYRVVKRSPTPGPRAEAIQPVDKGDEYVYHVDKYWIVQGVEQDGRLVLRTRRGKQHVIDPADPQLRHANLIERLFSGWRFPQPDGDNPNDA
jgi:hypothetical protein